MNTLTQATRLLACCLLGGTLCTSSAQVTREIITGSGAAPLVRLEVVPPQGTSAFAIEEWLQPQVRALDVNADGIYDSDTAKVKWGPFFGADPITLEYRLAGPAETTAIEGVYAFDDSVSSSASESTSLPDPETNFHGWRMLRLSAEALSSASADPRSDSDRDGLSLLHEYAFAGNLNGPEGSDLVALSFDGEGGVPAVDVAARINNEAGDLNFIFELSDGFGEWSEADLASLGVTPLREARDGDSGAADLMFKGIAAADLLNRLVRVRAELRNPGE